MNLKCFLISTFKIFNWFKAISDHNMEDWAGESIAKSVAGCLELIVESMELILVGMVKINLRLQITTSLSLGSIKLFG